MKSYIINVPSLVLSFRLNEMVILFAVVAFPA